MLQVTLLKTVSEKRALVLSLGQLAYYGPYLCLFRWEPLPQIQHHPLTLCDSGHLLSGGPGFDGIIKWKPHKETVPLRYNKRRRKHETIIWFGEGDKQSEIECAQKINAFVNFKQNGIDRTRQFRFVEKWFWGLWEKAIELWGIPKVAKHGIVVV